MTHSRQNDGTYNLLLAGLARGRIRRELVRKRLYREAEVELLPDEADAESIGVSEAPWKDRLLRAFRQFHPGLLVDNPSIEQLLHDQVPLGMLVDVMAFAAPLELHGKQRLLAEPSVTRRVEQLIEQLARLDPGTTSLLPRSRSRFPLDFSDN